MGSGMQISGHQRRSTTINSMQCLGKVDSWLHTRVSNCRIIGHQVLEATEALI